ncbi:MAG: head-tail adaptor protein [Alphaproteobacteria bacterium]|nr:head-tail adaptor protein [Alphaproteobacteria bacterium]
MALQAGDLDRRITIERCTEMRDAFNNPVKTWGPLATVWASRADVSDSERSAAQEIGAEITTRFRIRWSRALSDVDPRDRVRFDGRLYGIAAVKEIGRREGLEITASARSDIQD